MGVVILRRNKSGMAVDEPAASTHKKAPEKRKRDPEELSDNPLGTKSRDDTPWDFKRMMVTLPEFTGPPRDERPACPPPCEPPQSIENYLDLDEIDSASSSDSEEITQRTRNSSALYNYHSSSFGIFSPVVARRASTETNITPFADSERSASQLELTEEIEEKEGRKTGMQYN